MTDDQSEPCMDDLVVNRTITIPADELVFATSRSSGPGGQNVNKTNTRVTLLFDLEHTQALSSDERAAVREALAERINANGVLRVVAQRERSQLTNKNVAVARLRDLIRYAVTPAAERTPTLPTQAARKARLASKRAHSALKRGRAETKRLRRAGTGADETE